MQQLGFGCRPRGRAMSRNLASKYGDRSSPILTRTSSFIAASFAVMHSSRFLGTYILQVDCSPSSLKTRTIDFEPGQSRRKHTNPETRADRCTSLTALAAHSTLTLQWQCSADNVRESDGQLPLCSSLPPRSCGERRERASLTLAARHNHLQEPESQPRPSDRTQLLRCG